MGDEFNEKLEGYKKAFGSIRKEGERFLKLGVDEIKPEEVLRVIRRIDELQRDLNGESVELLAAIDRSGELRSLAKVTKLLRDTTVRRFAELKGKSLGEVEKDEAVFGKKLDGYLEAVRKVHGELHRLFEEGDLDERKEEVLALGRRVKELVDGIINDKDSKRLLLTMKLSGELEATKNMARELKKSFARRCGIKDEDDL